jgi:pimeloyl-ACP methyl ester carboxylesterase
MLRILPVLLLLLSLPAVAQKKYTPKIETCDCRFTADSNFTKLMPESFRSDWVFTVKQDSAFTARCGYLIVPENRNNPASKMVRLPFVVLQGKNPGKKADPLLFTSGGPGNSSLSWINGNTARLFANDRDCIAFEQRGTRYAIPHLRTLLLDSVMRIAYRKNLSKDSMWLIGVKLYKKELLRRGIDIDGYNSDATVADIGDLLTELKIDSVNLHGGSYSGGLMTAVAQRYPARVRSLVLDSPLPMFSPIDEDEHRHFLEALHVLGEHAKKDSVATRYHNIENNFHQYFNRIRDSSFTATITDPATQQPINVQYTKNELLDIIVGGILDAGRLKTAPAIIMDITGGDHKPYINPKLEGILRRNTMPDGMRMLVSCADQYRYHDPAMVKQLFSIYPYLEGYHIHDVWEEVCACWNNAPVLPSTKRPFYTTIPALLVGGEMDAACSPRYVQELQHYMINAQAFIFGGRSHGVFGRTFNTMMQQFLSNPWQPVPVTDSTVQRIPR